MEKTWRWFGKKDPITLSMLRQIGVEGIVTALHDVPNGEIWQPEKIADMVQYIEAAGLRWSVVESLPVSESIKYAGKDRDELIDKYIVSLANLGKAGVQTVCYNFMPKARLGSNRSGESQRRRHVESLLQQGSVCLF